MKGEGKNVDLEASKIGGIGGKKQVRKMNYYNVEEITFTPLYWLILCQFDTN